MISHVSFSAIKGYLRCPARQYALDQGDFIWETSQAMLEGQYLEALLCDSVPPEGVLKKNGEPYAWSEKVRTAAMKAKKSPLVMEYLEGAQQLRREFMLDEVKWVTIPDIVNHEKKRIVDIKKTKSIEEWSYSAEYGTRVPFYTDFDYWLQLGIAQMAFPDYDCFLLAVSMETPADIQVLQLDNNDMLDRVDQIRKVQDGILKMRMTGEGLTSCGKCDYCRKNQEVEIKEIRRFVDEIYDDS